MTQKKQSAHLYKSELIVDEQSKQETWHNQEVMPEGVVLLVICFPHHLMVPHVPHNGKGASKEDEFHHCVVHRMEHSE